MTARPQFTFSRNNAANESAAWQGGNQVVRAVRVLRLVVGAAAVMACIKAAVIRGAGPGQSDPLAS